VALLLFFVAEWTAADNMLVEYAVSITVVALYVLYVVRREKIDVKALIKAILRR
jgi:hypothetical protein